MIEQIGDHRDIADIVRRQFDGDDLMGISVDGQVELSPPPVRPDAVLLVEPFALAVNLDAGAVDQDMQRLVVNDQLWQDSQTAASTAECRMVGDSDPNAEQVRDRAQRTLGLAKRLVEHQTQCQSGFDGDVGVDGSVMPRAIAVQCAAARML